MVVSRRCSVATQQPDPLGDRRVVGHDGSAVTDPAEILGGIEAVRRGCGRRRGIAGSVRLRRVLHDRDAEVGQLGGAAVEVDRDHGPGASGARLHGRVAVEGAGVGSHVDRDRDGPDGTHGGRGRHRGERGHDHLVSRPDAHRQEAETERIRPGGDRDGMAAAAERRELGLECLGLGTEQEMTGPEDPLDRRREVRLEAGDATRRRPPRGPSERSRRRSAVPLAVSPVERDGASDPVDEVGVGDPAQQPLRLRRIPEVGADVDGISIWGPRHELDRP